MTDIEETIKLRKALIGELNILQEKHTLNEYDEDTIGKLMYTKERINRLTRKIDTLTFKDNKRE